MLVEGTSILHRDTDPLRPPPCRACPARPSFVVPPGGVPPPNLVRGDAQSVPMRCSRITPVQAEPLQFEAPVEN